MKKSIIPIIVIILVVLGLIGYFVSSRKKNQSLIQFGNNQKAENSVTGKNSLIDLIGQGKNVKCTYSSSTNETETSGTVYISNKKVRVDYSSTFENKKNSGSMIRNEEFSYIWSSITPQGIKIKNSLAEIPTGSPQDSQTFDQTAKMDYRCQNWIPNNSMFTPPSEIKFNEFSFPIAQPTAGTDNQATCSVCNSLSGETKKVCLTQLGCQ